MTDTIDPKLTDKRTAARHLASGRLDEKAFDRYLKNLPDCADKLAPVETTMFDGSGDAAAEGTPFKGK